MENSYLKCDTLDMEDSSDLDNGSKPLLGSPHPNGSWNMRSFTGPKKLGQVASLILSQSMLICYCVLSTTVILILTAAILARHPYNAAGSRSFHASFGADPSYMSLDHKFDELWEDLGSKELIIKLPDADSGGKPMHGTISMFHQLHCLSSLRNALQQAREGVDPGLDWRDNDHWPHCLDYLRKTLLCRADDVVERRLIFDNGTLSHFIDGSQDIRQCWDNRHLIRVMRDHGRHVTTRPFP